MYIVKLLKM